jgi:hypothetical protein
VAKAYRLVRSILATAVEDELPARNPCQIKHGGVERSVERVIPTVKDVEKLSAAVPARYSVVPWLAAAGGLRRGEIFGLARRPRGRPVRSVVWRNAWAAARRSTGLDGLRAHDLRHLAGTLNGQAGATIKESTTFLGHSSPRAAMRYQHAAADRATEIARRVGDLL